MKGGGVRKQQHESCSCASGKRATSSVLDRQEVFSLGRASALPSDAEMMEESLLVEVMMAMTPSLTMGIREEFACLACL